MAEITYFAHSMRIYNTEEEEQLLARIQKKFGGEVLNPNCPEVSKARDPMDACYLMITASQRLVFSEHQGHLGRGVYSEILFARKRQMPIYLVTRWRVKRYNGYFEIVDPSDWKIRYARRLRRGGRK